MLHESHRNSQRWLQGEPHRKAEQRVNRQTNRFQAAVTSTVQPSAADESTGITKEKKGGSGRAEEKVETESEKEVIGSEKGVTVAQRRKRG